jgi:tight adherence protein C
VLGDRREALQNFADRINLPSARSIVATLKQTMRYGTPLAQSLRLLAAEMRSARLLRMEERAARMPVLLTLPLMGFILPSLVMVVVGPAILKIIDTFSTLLK